MSRSPDERLEDILKGCRRIIRYTTGMEREEFLANDLVYDAVIKNLLVVGEAVKTLPDTVRSEMPDIPWREIAGLRDVLIHVYFRVNPSVLWSTVSEDIPALYERVERRLYGPPLFE